MMQKFAATLEKEHLSGLVLPLFRSLTTDDQDSVRLLAIENCAAIAQLLSPEENAQHVLPIVRSSVEDRSWRVRFSVAKDFFPVREFFVTSARITMSVGLTDVWLLDMHSSRAPWDPKSQNRNSSLASPTCCR